MIFLKKRQELDRQRQKIPKCDVSCKGCGSREFTFYGVSKISVAHFAGYKCNNCGRELALEIDREEYLKFQDYYLKSDIKTVTSTKYIGISR